MKYWDKAWSVVDGCAPVSPACDHCWLAAITYRFEKRGASAINGVPYFHGEIILRHDRLDLPTRTKKPTVWAIWSDLYHEAVPESFIADAYNVMASWTGDPHTFLILTKRPERMKTILEQMPEYVSNNFSGDSAISLAMEVGQWPLPSVWHGTTVENQQCADERILYLLQVPGKRFISVEPMLGPINMEPYLTRVKGGTFQDDTIYRAIDAVICGCESGPKRRETKIEWVRDLRDQCEAAGVPFLLKQLDVCGKVQELPALDGYVYDVMPWRKI